MVKMVDKIKAQSKIMTIFNNDKYSTDEEKIAVITALGELKTKEAYLSLIKIYEESNKTSEIKMATIMAIAKCAT